MFRSRSWFGGGWGRPKNPHSLEHLKYLYNVLARNQTVSEHNRGLLVESLRCIAEILIWGDQNDSSVFDFFLEKNMLSFFLRIMRQRSGGSSYVCVQLLQTLNILFENIRNETSLYYLLSNNHVNSIIVHKFDFSDEEVMAYYISFLKTLSLKLNAHTIHFFYNEHTNDFPLYTEAIKFFNHPESMVRIAVRTLTLNVYRVEDASMLAFIRDRTAAPYFSNIVWFIGKHILELDACVRNDADHQSHNRLADLVAEHLDHLHYINDILCLNIIDLNRVLTEHLLHKLFIPLYIYSLTGCRDDDDDDAPNTSSFSNNSSSDVEEHSDSATTTTTTTAAATIIINNGRVSSVVALFLLSQVFLIITHAPLVRTLAWIILKADKSIFQRDHKDLIERCNETQEEPSNNVSKKQVKVVEEEEECVPTIEEQKNATDEEKLLVTTPTENICTSPFFEAVLKALDCSENDYTALFSLSLLYALGNNKGIPNELLRRVLRPEWVESTGDLRYNTSLIDKIVQIVNMSCQPTCRVRLVTLELSLKLMLQLVSPTPSDEHEHKSMAKAKVKTCPLAEVHRAAMETARAHSTALVRNFYKSEEIFLDMFEHEYDLFQLRYCDMTKGPLNVEWLCMDSAILLPPTGTPMTGISFTKRLPCGEVERARRAIRVYFLVRDTFLSLTGEPETQLPLTNPQACVQVDTVLDLSISRYNSDLISCVVVWKDGQKIRRFLVIDVLQLILVEPDTKKLGWGVVKLVGFLQDIEVVGDKDDSRCLHITIHRPLSASNVNRVPLLSAKFIFDDHIRCMAAKQRLTKGRIKARQKKMQHIARLLDIPGQTGPASPAYVGGGVYSTRITGRGNRENRPLFCTGRVPGFATPRRDSAPATSDIASASTSRRTRGDADSPARLLEKKMDKTNGSAKSRDNSSGRNNRSRDGSPRMPRPRSEEIPLELIKRTQSSLEASPKISILPRPQQVQSQSDDVAVTSVDEETATTSSISISTVQANEQLNSEETSFIAQQQDKRMPRRKGAIETV